MTDYIGKHVKIFESGSKGSLCLESCGYDWGLSCGSYQITLRWGTCIKFLKTYFPSISQSLYFNTSQKDFSSKEYPGQEYCSSPEDVISVWRKGYEMVGEEMFFSYEHDFIRKQYYEPIKKKVLPYIDLDVTNRAFQECFWSWAIHKGVTGSFNYFMQVLNENDLVDVYSVGRYKLFDLIYDKRYSINPFNRYKKGLYYGDSEREVLRKFLNTNGYGVPPVQTQTPVPAPIPAVPPKSRLRELGDRAKAVTEKIRAMRHKGEM